MARNKVVQVRCDRCKRVELLPESPPKEQPDFEGRLFDKVIRYDDICVFCKKALENYWKDLLEWDREVKHQFGPTISGESAPPMEVAPTLSPPKPHSKEGGKR